MTTSEAAELLESLAAALRAAPVAPPSARSSDWRDAMRYRWIRDSDDRVAGISQDWGHFPRGAELDAVVDGAINNELLNRMHAKDYR